MEGEGGKKKTILMFAAAIIAGCLITHKRKVHELDHEFLIVTVRLEVYFYDSADIADTLRICSTSCSISAYSWFFLKTMSKQFVTFQKSPTLISWQYSNILKIHSNYLFCS